MNCLVILTTYFTLSIAGYTGTDKKVMLDSHNQYRRSVQPEASNMAEMVWDDDLDDLAQKWASRCIFEHPKKNPDYKGVGQNIFLTTGKAVPTDAAVRAWYNEEKNYNIEEDSCQVGKVCGHYTQVVWAKTTNVGCAAELCPVLISKKRNYNNAWIVVCNYSPAGNYRGVRPYIPGNTCSNCKSEENCRDGLCTACDLTESDCECKRECSHCGLIDEDTCSCSCPKGYFGSTCEDFCENTHHYCGANPGWPVSWCTSTSYVPKNCPLMCGLCEEGPRDPVC